MNSKLSGIWYNELGSTMVLNADVTGRLSGKYKSAVGNAEDFYVLSGRYDVNAPSDKGVSLAWTVAYNNSFRNAHSTAGWSGQYFDDLEGEEKILTHWLLNVVFGVFRSSLPSPVAVTVWYVCCDRHLRVRGKRVGQARLSLP